MLQSGQVFDAAVKIQEFYVGVPYSVHASLPVAVPCLYGFHKEEDDSSSAWVPVTHVKDLD